MPLSRRQVVAAIPAAALAASLPQGRALAQDGRKVVTFWFGQANSDGQAVLRNDLVDAFNASQDKYLLQIEIKGAAVNNLLKVALVAGNGPDIVQTAGPAYLTAIANAGQVLALDDFAEKYKWKERFLPALLNTSVYGGKLYALPRDYESIHLFYNKEVFSQNGWKLPTNRAEFEQVADAALAKGIVPFGAGNADWKGVNEWLMTVFFNNVAGPDNGLELETGSEAVQGQLGFPTEASGEERELKVLVQPLEQPVAGNPTLAQNQAVAAVAVKKFLEIIHDLVVVRCDAFIADHGCRERPVVVPAAAVLPFLNHFPCDALAREMLHGLLNGLAIRLADIHQHAIHIEYQKTILHYQISRNS